MGNRSGRGLLILSSLIMFLLGFETSGFQLVLLDIAREFKLNLSSMGTLAAAQYAAYILAPLAVGKISDRVGKKRISLIFAGIFTAGCALTAFSNGAGIFIFGAFLVGSGFSVSESMMCAAMIDAWGEKGDGPLGFTQALYGLGAVASPFLISHLIQAYGLSWRIHFLVTGGAFALLIPFLARTRFVRVSVKEEMEEKERGEMKLLTLPFLCLFVCILIYTGLENGVGYFLDFLFSEKFAAARMSAAALSVFWLSMTLSRFLFSFLKIRIRSLVLTLFSASALLLFLLPWVETAASAMLVGAAAGFAFGPVWAGLVYLAGQENRRRSGLAVSVMGAGSGFGGMVSPMLFGAVAAGLGLSYSYWMLAAAALFAAFLMLVYMSRRPKTPA